MSFWNELKRRNVVKVGAAYLIVAWLIAQVIATVEGPLNLPGAVATIVIVLLGVGFPIALLLAWAYEMTPDGIASRTLSTEATSTQPAAGTPFAGAVPLLILAAVGFLIVDEYLFDDTADRIAAAPREVTGTQRTSLLLPPEHMISFGWNPGRSLAISPDGRTVVYVAIAQDATPEDVHLAVRTLDSPTVRALPGTDGARQPFLSPDGESVGFFVEETLMKISWSGGNPIPLIDDINGGVWSFGVWLDDGTIVFGSAFSNGLQRVSEDGGDVEQVTEWNPVASERIHLPFDYLPGTGTVLFTTLASGQGPAIEAVDVDTRQRQVIQPGAAVPFYIDDEWLLHGTLAGVAAARFDRESLTLSDPRIPLIDAMRRDGDAGQGLVPQMAVARNGTVALAPPVESIQQIVLVERQGRVEVLSIDAGNYGVLSASSDGRYLALTAGDPGSLTTDVLIHDLVRGTSTRLTERGRDDAPEWHPDGRTIVFRSATSEQAGLYTAEVGGEPRLLIPREAGPDERGVRNVSWHPQDAVLAYTRQSGTESDIWIVTTDGEAERRPLVATAAFEDSPQFSPDGRSFAYVSRAMGEPRIYLRGYPGGDEIAVSTGYGVGPRWSTDGAELYFQGEHDGAMMMLAVDVPDDGTEIGLPEPLFVLNTRTDDGEILAYRLSDNAGMRYDVLPDGRFVMQRGRSLTRQREIVIVQNWLPGAPEQSPR